MHSMELVARFYYVTVSARESVDHCSYTKVLNALIKQTRTFTYYIWIV